MINFIPIILGLHIHGESVVWRDHNNKIVKKVNYDKNLVFTYKKWIEDEIVDALPYGHIYNLKYNNNKYHISSKKITSNASWEKHDTRPNDPGLSCYIDDEYWFCVKDNDLEIDSDDSY